MKTKCTGLMGRIFGHKWSKMLFSEWGCRVCQRCGAVKGEKK